MPGLRITLSFFASFWISLAAGQDTINLVSLGYVPGSRQNAVEYVRRALALASSKKKPVLYFPAGRYDFWPAHCAEKKYFESNTDVIPLRRCPILLENQHGLVLDGGNAQFVFHDRMQPITIDHCSDISIKNLTIDWDIPLNAQAEVVEVTDDHLDLAINTRESPYVIEGEKLFFVGEGWKNRWWDAMEFDRQTRQIVYRTGDEGCLGDGFENYRAQELKDGLVRLIYPFKRRPSVGNFLVLRHGARDHAGIFIFHSQSVRIENLGLYQTAGLGILSQYSKDLGFYKVRCVPNPEKNRIFSGHDDGLHFSNCKGQITVDRCQFRALMDDPINVHGTSVRILARKSPRSLLCQFMHEQSIGFEWAGKGDRVGFIENEAMNTLGTARVAAFHPRDARVFEISFLDSIPAGVEVGDALENLTWTPDVWIKNSEFGSNRARGILVSTPGKVLIEKNRFESSGTAILIAGDANGWYESGAVHDVEIRNNRFEDGCLSSLYQFCEGIISIFPEIPKLDPEKPFHRNIRIEHNEFHPFDYPVLYAKSTEGLVFSHNILERSYRFAPFHSRHFMITLEACKKVQIEGNICKDSILGKNIALIRTSNKEVLIDPEQGLQTESIP